MTVFWARFDIVIVDCSFDCFATTQILLKYLYIYILQTNLVLVLYDIYGAVTRMEESQRIQRSRKGHRAHLTKVLNKATTIMESDEAPNAMQIASLSATIEQLARKRTALNELNEKLLAIITDPDDIEQEIMDVEDIECEINEKSAQISAFCLVTL